MMDSPLPSQYFVGVRAVSRAWGNPIGPRKVGEDREKIKQEHVVVPPFGLPASLLKKL